MEVERYILNLLEKYNRETKRILDKVYPGLAETYKITINDVETGNMLKIFPSLDTHIHGLGTYTKLIVVRARMMCDIYSTFGWKNPDIGEFHFSLDPSAWVE